MSITKITVDVSKQDITIKHDDGSKTSVRKKIEPAIKLLGRLIK